jgi:hypothetical protein
VSLKERLKVAESKLAEQRAEKEMNVSLIDLDASSLSTPDFEISRDLNSPIPTDIREVRCRVDGGLSHRG